jgi:S-(hydroxymethyl)glutathione dehydrogenase/alcohol dehydrogenase
MNAKAAVTDGRGKYWIDEIFVTEPRADEVLVEIRAAGICHTDWKSLSWNKNLILGHEGAGLVKAVGGAVDHVKPGEAVVLNWAIPCRECFQCERGNQALCEKYSPVAGIDPRRGHAHPEGTFWKGNPIERSFNIGTFSTLTLVRKEAVMPIPVSIAFPAACIVGCGVMTGFGSVVNAARIEPGALVVVIGCGGVGLNVIQGARISGARKIIALDLKESRLEMARRFGATDTVRPSAEDKQLLAASREVKALTGGRGADYAFECTSVPALGAAPLLMVRHGGMALQLSGIEQDLTIDMNCFEWDKIYLNPLYGKCRPGIDFPRIFELYQRGELLLDELVTRTYRLEELPLAFDDMHAGRNAKGVLVFE